MGRGGRRAPGGCGAPGGWAVVLACLCGAVGQLDDLQEPVLSNPPASAVDVPPRLISVVLTFAESVAAGAGGSVFVRDREGAEDFAISCGGGLLVAGRSVIVPLDGALLPSRAYDVELQRACVVAADGSGRQLGGAGSLLVGNFSTLASSTRGVRLVQEVLPVLPVSSLNGSAQAEAGPQPLARPVPHSYVQRGHSLFSLQFTEAVQRGTGMLRWYRSSHGSTYLHSELDVSTAPPSRLQLDPGVPGRVVLFATALEDPGEYSLQWDEGAFLDGAGVAISESSDTDRLGNTYTVRLGNQLTDMYPREATLPRRHNITTYTNLVLEFDGVVRPGPPFAQGRSGIMLCKQWRVGPCPLNTQVTVSAGDVHFLGSSVLINPPVLLEFYMEYHFFVSTDTFLFFSGIHTSSAVHREWSFRTELGRSRFDSGPPVLVAIRPDCDGDGQVSTSSDCRVEGGGPAPFEAEQLLDPAPMLPLGTRFFTFFREPITWTGIPAKLIRHNDPSGAARTYSAGPAFVNDTRGSSVGASDCIAAFHPVLEPGSSYTLNIHGRVLTDRYGNAGWGVPYEGTSFSFTTPLGRPTFTLPANGAAGVNPQVAVQIGFAGYPEPVPGSTNQIIAEFVDQTEGSIRRIPINDIDQVQFEEQQIRIAPQPELSLGHHYIFRLLSERVRFLLEDVVLEFDTQTDSGGSDGDGRPTLQIWFPPEREPAPGNTDISLYFSDAVRVADSPKLVYVVEEGQPQHIMIPVDNSDPSQGLITAMGGRTFRIDPRDNLNPGREVEVHFRNGTFLDASGVELQGVGHFTGRPPIRFRTLEPVLGQVRANGSADDLPPPLEGGDLHWAAGQWLLLFGRRPGTCLPRAYASALGDAWSEVAYAGDPGPLACDGEPEPARGLAGGAATALDGRGCVLLVGARGLWRSCDGAASWAALAAPVSPAPPGGAAPPAPWPGAGLEGHAAAVLDGWRLVVADAPRQSLWAFRDANLTTAERRGAPWAARRDPLLAATGDGALLLVGGSRCADTGADGGCIAGGQSLADVWRSDDAGLSWRCLSAGGSSAAGAWARGRAALAAAHDGALLLLAGAGGRAAGGGRSLSTDGDTTEFLEAASDPEVPEELLHPPRLLLRWPPLGAQDAPSGGLRALLAYSAPVALGGNLASPASLTNLAVGAEVPLVVSVSGPVVTLAAEQPLQANALHRLELRAEVVGINGRPASTPGTWTFRTAPAGLGSGGVDVTPPELVGTFPPTEDPLSPTHRWATSRPLVLTFSETVHLGTTGAVRLAPRTLGGGLALGPGAGLHAAGHRAIVAAEGLLPGEIYDIVLEGGIFVDTAGNPCGRTNFTISFAHLLQFRPVQDGREALTIPGWRWGSAFAVSASNDVLVLGGTEAGAAGRGQSHLNDVWMLRTGKLINCASAEEEPQSCSRQNCSGEPPTLGRRPRRWRVWRAPSEAGRPCVDANGLPSSNPGQVVAEREEPCPCPRCPGVPQAPLPERMVNTGLEGFALARADVDPRPLVCTEGFRPNGSFWCRVATQNYGVWDDYPSCVPADCQGTPQIAHVDRGFNSSQCADCPPTDVKDCGALLADSNASVPSARGLLHGSMCAFGCLPGYRPSGPLRCLFGQYEGSCEKRNCLVPEALEGMALQCDESTLAFGSRCHIQCQVGWALQGTDYWECAVAEASEQADATPTPNMQVLGHCVRKECGPLPDFHENAEFAEATSLALGGRARLSCTAGYQQAARSDAELRCEVESFETGNVSWQGTIICEKRPCMAPPSEPHGSFRCSPDDGLTGDRCQLLCPPGFEVTGGDGVYVCDGENYVRNGSCTPQPCSRPPLVQHSVALAPDCPEVLRHGRECHVICRAAHNEVGRYRCHGGVLAERPACVFEGGESEVVARHLAEATLRADVAGGTANASALQGGVEAALVAGLGALGFDHPVNEVQLVARPRTAGRRLGTAEARHAPTAEVRTSSRQLQGAMFVGESNYTLSVTWWVHTPNNSAARDVTLALQADSNRGTFGDAFGNHLELGLGFEVQSFQLVNAVPVVWYENPSSSRSDLLTSTDESVPTLSYILMMFFVGLTGFSILAVFLAFLIVLARKRVKARRAQAQQAEVDIRVISPPPIAVPVDGVDTNRASNETSSNNGEVPPEATPAHAAVPAASIGVFWM